MSAENRPSSAPPLASSSQIEPGLGSLNYHATKSTGDLENTISVSVFSKADYDSGDGLYSPSPIREVDQRNIKSLLGDPYDGFLENASRNNHKNGRVTSHEDLIMDEASQSKIIEEGKRSISRLSPKQDLRLNEARPEEMSDSDSLDSAPEGNYSGGEILEAEIDQQLATQASMNIDSSESSEPIVSSPEASGKIGSTGIEDLDLKQTVFDVVINRHDVMVDLGYEDPKAILLKKGACMHITPAERVALQLISTPKDQPIDEKLIEILEYIVSPVAEKAKDKKFEINKKAFIEDLKSFLFRKENNATWLLIKGLKNVSSHMGSWEGKRFEEKLVEQVLSSGHDHSPTVFGKISSRFGQVKHRFREWKDARQDKALINQETE